MPVDEALAKDKKHQEEKKALHVGDEVECKGIKGYIVKILPDTYIRVLTKDGTCTLLPEKCKRTGKTNEDLVKALAAFDYMDGEK